MAGRYGESVRAACLDGSGRVAVVVAWREHNGVPGLDDAGVQGLDDAGVQGLEDAGVPGLEDAGVPDLEEPRLFLPLAGSLALLSGEAQAREAAGTPRVLEQVGVPGREVD